MAPREYARERAKALVPISSSPNRRKWPIASLRRSIGNQVQGLQKVTPRQCNAALQFNSYPVNAKDDGHIYSTIKLAEYHVWLALEEQVCTRQWLKRGCHTYVTRTNTLYAIFSSWWWLSSTACVIYALDQFGIAHIVQHFHMLHEK